MPRDMAEEGNMSDYGSRIRELANYLETVPDSKYDYCYPPCATDQDGLTKSCALGHGFLGKVIPHSLVNNNGFWCDKRASKWLGFTDFLGLHDALSETAGVAWPMSRALHERKSAIQCLRAYADKHYPVVTRLHEGIPTEVLELFKLKVAA